MPVLPALHLMRQLPKSAFQGLLVQSLTKSNKQAQNQTQGDMNTFTDTRCSSNRHKNPSCLLHNSACIIIVFCTFQRLFFGHHLAFPTPGRLLKIETEEQTIQHTNASFSSYQIKVLWRFSIIPSILKTIAQTYFISSTQRSPL